MWVISRASWARRRADAPYLSRRTETWLQLKCHQRRGFVIAGHTDRTDGSPQVGSLLSAANRFFEIEKFSRDSLWRNAHESETLVSGLSAVSKLKIQLSQSEGAKLALRAAKRL
ncbi:MAG: hypothetical protein EOP82_02090 [Variovorax sp.]|nr:MAG: hypothetical protein EOP82_02090 [Variovorax sp.]